MRVWYFIIGLISMAGSLSGQQGVQLLQSAEAVAQGGMQAAQKGISSLHANPAGLVELTHFSALAGGESRYLGTNIQAGGAGVAIPTSAGVLAAGIAYFGLPAYNEQRLHLSFSKKLLNKFALSVRGYLLNTNIQQYGSAYVVSGDIGMQAYLSKRMTLGFMMVNPAQIGLVEDSDLPTLFILGARYDFGETFSFGLELEKGLDQTIPDTSLDPNLFLNTTGRINVKAGMEYRPAEVFAFRLGIKSLQPEYSFGIGYQISSRFWLDTVGSYHEILGFTPGVSIRYQGHD